MGAWGEGPFDNDTAGDVVAKMMEPCRAIDAATSDQEARRYYAAARVGIQVRLLAHGTDILGGAPLRPALDALQRMRADAEWLAGWRPPKKIKTALDKEIEAVKRAMKKKPKRVPRRSPLEGAKRTRPLGRP